MAKRPTRRIPVDDVIEQHVTDSMTGGFGIVADKIAERAVSEAFADEGFRRAFHDRVQRYAQALLDNLMTPPRNGSKPRKTRRRK
jgi:hypothetical protein